MLIDFAKLTEVVLYGGSGYVQLMQVLVDFAEHAEVVQIVMTRNIDQCYKVLVDFAERTEVV